MFMFWTIATLWVLYIFDSDWFARPIRDHSIQSLLVLVPGSLFEWSLIASWLIPFLFVIIYTIIVRQMKRVNRQSIIPSLLPGAFGGMRRFDWVLIALSSGLAIAGWTMKTTELLLTATIVVIGLSFSKFERWCTSVA